jgi:serine protease Do
MPDRVMTGKIKDFFLEAGMMSLKNGRVAAISAFMVCFLAISSNAQTRIFSNLLPSDSKSYLGIQMEDVNADNFAKYKLNSERGVIIKSVVKGSPAEAANLKADDVILEFAGMQVWSSTQFSRLVQETPPGRKVDLAISRDGKKMSLTAQIKERDDRQNNEERAEILPRDLFGSNDRFFQYRIPEPQTRDNKKPKLGITLQPLTDQQAEYYGVEGKKGVLVSSVADNSPSSGKLNLHDVIISADGKKIEDPEDLVQIVQNKSGDISLKVIRNKKEITVVINLPEEGKREQKGYKL